MAMVRASTCISVAAGTVTVTVMATAVAIASDRAGGVKFTPLCSHLASIERQLYFHSPAPVRSQLEARDCLFQRNGAS